jgi:SAM-dependent methyltransferase
MTFKDHFSGHAAAYAASRPGYPDELLDWVSALPPERRLAWDCATGSGQAAVGLAGVVAAVVATDASARQIDRARPHERVRYVVAPADRAPTPDGAVDLVTVAQALHWFDLDAFYAEVRRVARPGAVLAAWCYGLHAITPEVDAVVGRLYRDIVGPDWPPERRQVEEGYARLPFPFDEVATPPFRMTQRWDLGRLLGYLATWSSVQRYRQRTGRDPLDLVRDDLQGAWDDPGQQREVSWPLHPRIGRL